MRKIVANLFVSLDGVVEAPETWTGPYFTDDIGQMIGSEMAQADTLLMGRGTYQTFAASFAGRSGGMADQMNGIPKIVVFDNSGYGRLAEHDRRGGAVRSRRRQAAAGPHRRHQW